MIPFVFEHGDIVTSQLLQGKWRVRGDQFNRAVTVEPLDPTIPATATVPADTLTLRKREPAHA
jgi:hypothetical protein